MRALTPGPGQCLQAVQESENDTAEICIVCAPEGTSLQMGGLHPRASLYEKPVNLDAAQKAHAEFRRVMRDNGVRVVTVREILAYGVDDHMGARVELEQFAMLVRRRRCRRSERCPAASEANLPSLPWTLDRALPPDRPSSFPLPLAYFLPRRR